MENIIESALSPFKGFNMAWVYDNHGQFIDGIIFFSIFLGISRVAFAKRFPGKPGTAISVAFSFALTIGLLVVEDQFNFSLRSFGGLAIGVIFLITGFFMVTLARSAGLSPITAFALTYCLIYLSVSSMLPNLLDFIATRAPWLNGVLGIVFLVSLFKTLQATLGHLLPRGKTTTSNLNTFSGADNASGEIKLEDNEMRSIKQLRMKMTAVDDIIDTLNQIEKILRTDSTLSPQQLDYIRRSLAEISTKEAVFLKNYNDLERRFKMFGRIDTERLERLTTELDTVPDNLKRIKMVEIDLEKRKVEYDKRILEIKADLDAKIQSFNTQIVHAAGQITSNLNSAVNGVGKAKETVIQMKRPIDMARQLERELLDLHKTQQKLFKGEKNKR
jgi:hypothetical protein